MTLYRVQQGMNYGKCPAYDPKLRKLKPCAGRTLGIYTGLEGNDKI